MDSLLPPDHTQAGFPEEPHFQDRFFCPSADAVVVRCRDRSLGHPGSRVYHRRSGDEAYRRTFDLGEAESIDSIVVAVGAPVVFAVVVTWTTERGRWGGSRARVVSAHIDDHPPKHATHKWDGEPWSTISELVGVSEDGEVLFCVANAQEPLREEPRPIRYAIFRWEVLTGNASEVASLPGVFW